MTENTRYEQTTPISLTQKQREVLQRVNDFLTQFADREQMQASYYLAKYKGYKTCEETCVGLKWALQEAFNV